MAEIIPVVLCGGAGTRLWPYSRERCAKQFVPLFGDVTLFQETMGRVTGSKFSKAIVITSHASRFLVSDQLLQIGIEADVLIEPEGRDTLGAIALASEYVERQNPGSVILALAADHKIPNKTAFQSSLEAAVLAAEKGWIVTFGVKPSHTATGYGYIKPGPAIDGAKEVMAFIEKPCKERAERFIAEGCLWNSGIFCFEAKTVLEELDHFTPEALQAVRTALDEAKRDLGFLRIGGSFTQCPKTSFDYAIMEKTKQAVVLPVDFPWSDIGGWNEVWRISDQDDSGNVVEGDVMLQNVRDSLIKSSSRLVAAIGLENFIVIDTPDAVLVANKDCAQEIKDLVHKLKVENRPEVEDQAKVFRPWGWYQTIDNGERFKVKRISIAPGKNLSLQKHKHRAEHWVVVRGTATTKIDGKEKEVHENESIYVPIGSTHRLGNHGKIPVEIIEIQTGAYLEEDDIVRFEDDFGRD